MNEEVQRISKEDARKTINRMKSEKAVGPDDITVEETSRRGGSGPD